MYAKSEPSGRLSFSSILLCLAATPILITMGCDQALETYKQGCIHLEQGGYEQAVAEFDQALALCRQQGNKPCDLYQAKLAEAKSMAAEHFFALAQKALAETDLGLSQERVARALHYLPGEARFTAMQAQTVSQIAQAEDLRRRALALADQQQWDQAIQTLQQALGRYRSLPNGSRDLSSVRHRAYAFYCNAAHACLARDDWDGAVSEANRALSYEPNGSDAKAVIDQVADYRQAVKLIGEARVRLQNASDPQDTLSMLERAQRLYPSHPEVSGLLRAATEGVCDEKIDRAEELIDAGRIHDALDLLEDSNRILNGYRDASSRFAQVRQALAEHFVTRARTMRESNQHASALLDGLLALSYVPDLPEATAEVHAATVLLREQSVYSVGYVGFGAALVHRRTADALDAGLLVHLQTVKPPNVVLVDSMPFRRTLGLIAGNIIEVHITDPRLQSARPRNVDAFLIGQVLDRHIDVHQTTEYATSTYVSRTNTLPNPEHVDAVEHVQSLTNQLADVERRLAEARRRPTGSRLRPIRLRKGQTPPAEPPADSLDSLQAEIKDLSIRLAAARSRVATLPSHLRRPVEAEHRYPVVDVAKTARLVCAVRFVDAATGRVLHASQIVGEHTVHDRVVQPDPAHGVAPDPLELPGDIELTDVALQDALEQLYRFAEHFVWRAAERFVEPMRQARHAGQTDQALEYAVRHMFARPVRTPASDEALACLREAAGLRNKGRVPKLQPLLRERCGVLLAPGALPMDFRARDGRLVVTRFHGRPTPPHLRCPCDLVAVQGVPVRSTDTLQDVMSHYGPGQYVTLIVEREGSRHAIEVGLIGND